MHTNISAKIRKVFLGFMINVYVLAKQMHLMQVLQALEELAPKVGLPKGLDGWEKLASGAITAAYDNRSGYPNIYAGPINGGVMPLDDSSWPTWTDIAVDTYPHNPLAASHIGVDGRTNQDLIDDVWVSKGSKETDPYQKNSSTLHEFGDSVGDYMRTSQPLAGNADEDTQFYTYGA